MMLAGNSAVGWQSCGAGPCRFAGVAPAVAGHCRGCAPAILAMIPAPSMEAELSDGPHKMIHGLFLTVDTLDDGRMVAIASDGTPQLGHNPVTVLTLESVKSRREAIKWFDEIRVTRPWERRQ